MKKPVVVTVISLVLAAVGVVWWHYGRHRLPEELLLQGNVDLRQVDLPFKDNERIVEVLAQEGDRVRQGQVLARLDVGRLRARIERAQAQVAVQTEALRRLKNGSRPEEIAEARAGWDSARADAENAESQYERLVSISRVSGSRAVSQLDLDAALAAARVARAKLDSAHKALQLAVAGSRPEDVARGKAELDAANADLALLMRQLTDSELVAPTAAVVRSRLMEPGEMATPQRPVFSLALTDPKWVRVYVAETDLARLKPGMRADIEVDGVGQPPLRGWIGFISSMAEFTPKSVETTELRTSLVYEVRVFVKDPQDVLRLGMPTTVRVDLSHGDWDPQHKVASIARDTPADGRPVGRE
jgi:membrane fusion protein PltH